MVSTLGTLVALPNPALLCLILKYLSGFILGKTFSRKLSWPFLEIHVSYLRAPSISFLTAQFTQYFNSLVRAKITEMLIAMLGTKTLKHLFAKQLQKTCSLPTKMLRSKVCKVELTVCLNPLSYWRSSALLQKVQIWLFLGDKRDSLSQSFYKLGHYWGYNFIKATII